jgi:YbbR domain-containing protein
VVSSAADVREFRVSPSVVQVTLRGNKRALDGVQVSTIRPLVDLTGVEAGRRKKIEVSTPPGITFVSVQPQEVEVIVPQRR